MKRFALIVIGIFFALSILLPAYSADTKELRVITDRTETHLKDLFDYYTKLTGVKISPVYLESGLLSRLQARPTESDIVITSTANILDTAKKDGVLQPYSSTKIADKVKAGFRDPENYYFTTSYRARAVFYSKDRVKADELSTYEDLASPKWKGRVCIRSGYHEYNICFFSQMVVTNGLEKTKAFIKGLHDNLARTPAGNDRDQVRSIYEGKCDVAIVNSYYMGIMLSTAEQKAWGLSAKVFFPNQNDKGSYILCSGVALTKAKDNVAEATKLLEFLADDYAQQYFSNKLDEYSINDKLPLTEVNKKLGSEQKEVVNGKFKINFVPIAAIEKNRQDIIKILDEVNFDNK
jgi:iron(III) transport system substrate-binding protein